MEEEGVVMQSCRLGNRMEWDKYCKLIPPINFYRKWNVKIIPPIMGAMVRFLVEYKGREVSIYLDCHDNLGIYGGPYWEVFPDVNGDNWRCSMNDTETLVKKIDSIFNEKIGN